MPMSEIAAPTIAPMYPPKKLAHSPFEIFEGISFPNTKISRTTGRRHAVASAAIATMKIVCLGINPRLAASVVECLQFRSCYLRIGTITILTFALLHSELFSWTQPILLSRVTLRR